MLTIKSVDVQTLRHIYLSSPKNDEIVQAIYWFYSSLKHTQQDKNFKQAKMLTVGVTCNYYGLSKDLFYLLSSTLFTFIYDEFHLYIVGI